MQKGIDPYLTAAIIDHESTGKIYAVGKAGEIGIMQVMPYHFKEGENRFSPKINISRGLDYLKNCAEIEGRHSNRILSCYNGGPNRKIKKISSYENNVLKKYLAFK